MMQDAQTANQPTGAGERPAPLPLRNDTLLGVCEALGEDFGFNPLWLRAGLAAGLLWNAAAMVAIYLGLGLIVAISRLAFRDVRKPAPAAEATLAVEPANEREPELIAA